jgi:hypothetical protein
MSRRAHVLHESADRQIAQLAEQLSAAGRTALGRPCPGREKLGDGTIAAVAAHTTDNYQRIARFVAGLQDRGAPSWPDRHRASEIDPRALLACRAAARQPPQAPAPPDRGIDVRAVLVPVMLVHDGVPLAA